MREVDRNEASIHLVPPQLVNDRLPHPRRIEIERRAAPGLLANTGSHLREPLGNLGVRRPQWQACQVPYQVVPHQTLLDLTIRIHPPFVSILVLHDRNRRRIDPLANVNADEGASF
jgi:hypothetical protein